MVFVIESEDGESFASYIRIADASCFDDCADVSALKQRSIVS